MRTDSRPRISGWSSTCSASTAAVTSSDCPLSRIALRVWSSCAWTRLPNSVLIHGVTVRTLTTSSSTSWKIGRRACGVSGSARPRRISGEYPVAAFSGTIR